MTKSSRLSTLALLGSVMSTAGALAQSATSSVPGYANPAVPGATGDTVVRGNHSTIAGARDATLSQRYFQQSDGQEADRSGRAPTNSRAPVAKERR